ncbi:hypothetical protein [Aneurinibacillus migulanus]|uniref:Lipoprotein n=1 Tax=Aneurinibacillus migulanus TaxID=47500 RepID=A0A0D1XIF8_ANEMI|nr:hypothetical protein [Aneurinibacillus migulanus]KIV54051.1 hypothetical protein TS65_18985 [Aneurinibacillus migulanus]KON97706.1 hypothetical protein AF333_21975 [Aneurinibacillus migulanus]MED0894475.1 hypothetical protein [Aneurinibacillus migulanus]MED1617085.1 hypothetical protein [Aneurinibacillus migulanus]SDJ34189.1 hypothetical protein SAMN04487909_1168 [Aneurinibacillus migulanus]
MNRQKSKVLCGLLLVYFLLSACAPKQETVIAYVNEEPITKQNLTFLKVMNQVELAMAQEKEGEQVANQNVLLTQMIRLHAMAMLAEEKGYTFNVEQAKKEMEAMRKQYEAHPTVTKIIEAYGTKQFWTDKAKIHRLLQLSQRVQHDMIEKAKEKKPKANAAEVRFQAEKAYEDLVISQIGTLKIKLL